MAINQVPYNMIYEGYKVEKGISDELRINDKISIANKKSLLLFDIEKNSFFDIRTGEDTTTVEVFDLINNDEINGYIGVTPYEPTERKLFFSSIDLISKNNGAIKAGFELVNNNVGTIVEGLMAREVEVPIRYKKACGMNVRVLA